MSHTVRMADKGAKKINLQTEKVKRPQIAMIKDNISKNSALQILRGDSQSPQRFMS